jgi:L-Ala-D/L-Glu epimerase
MARRAQELGLDCMVGNMMGTSLGMAPAYLVSQLCKVVDLDGPVFLKDRSPNRSSVRRRHDYVPCRVVGYINHMERCLPHRSMPW